MTRQGVRQGDKDRFKHPPMTNKTTLLCTPTNTSDTTVAMTMTATHCNTAAQSTATFNGVKLVSGHGSSHLEPVAASRLDVALKRVCAPLFFGGAVNT